MSEPTWRPVGCEIAGQILQREHYRKQHFFGVRGDNRSTIDETSATKSQLMNMGLGVSKQGHVICELHTLREEYTKRYELELKALQDRFAAELESLEGYECP
jgi:hypothetical protein